MVEIIIVIAVVAVVGVVALASTRPDGHRAAEIAVRQMAGATATAMEQGYAMEQDAILRIDGGVTDGRFLAIARPTGFDATTIPAEQWTQLPEDVRWGSGAATTGPAGDAITGGGRMPVEVRCLRGRRCGVPQPAGAATYYLRHTRDEAAVYALTIGPTGQVQTFRYTRSNGSPVWSPVAR